MKYAWIKQHTNEFAVDAMCRFMLVSRNAYYDWLHREPSGSEKEDAKLMAIIIALSSKSRATYSTWRIKKALIAQGWIIGRWRIGRLMQKADLDCKTKRKLKGNYPFQA